MDVADSAPRGEPSCRFCSDSPTQGQLVSEQARHRRKKRGGRARAVVHPTPLYRIEGEPSRRADGIYDRMSPVGSA